ncbi:MAG TPA: endonuclease/exonuclease/phosphatase family protein [Solirubrobacteraceae bacterium]|jgi:endonuclease/exonuclease/phosphatase family metal-dependent hydrolase|nr:endonuclease/exonuclease/phosphatase family protein [Solirubrobacteraceae bacterium]
MRLRLLTWNLFHGRAVPPAGHQLLREFADELFGWEWDVALLQEVPPWWPAELARRPGVYQRSVLTSRNGLLPVRRLLASRWPDLVKSQGGGANAILVRDWEIAEHRAVRLRRLPERRWMHAVRLEPAGVWVGNLHCSGEDRRAEPEARRAGATLLGWAGGAPAALGGDFNLPDPVVDGFAYAGGDYVDHVLVSGAATAGSSRVMAAGRLSDHSPVAVTLECGEMSIAA